MAAGGDDQQVSLTHLDIHGFTMLKKWYAHSSCVKGVAFIQNSQELVSSGYD